MSSRWQTVVKAGKKSREEIMWLLRERKRELSARLTMNHTESYDIFPRFFFARCFVLLLYVIFHRQCETIHVVQTQVETKQSGLSQHKQLRELSREREKSEHVDRV